MDLVQKPALQRRRLLRRLTRLREDMGMTQLQVSKNLRWSQSKINRIEAGEVGISYTDLLALLKLYKVENQETVETMSRMAEVARRPSHPEISELYPRAFRKYLENEEIASRVRQFENAFIPGLLQTARYAKAVLETGHRLDEASEKELPKLEEEVRRKAEFRISRQEVFALEDAPGEGAMKGSFVLDEAVIRRMVGAEFDDTSVMTEQLLHLKAISRRRHPQIDICALPFSAGSNLGMQGSFVILDFPDVDDPPLLYIENSLEDFATTEDSHLTGRFAATFEKLQARAVWGRDFEDLLDDAIASMS